MNKIVFKHAEDNMHRTLGIADDRAEELARKCDKEMWLCQDPEGDEFDSGRLLERFINLAENDVEIVWLTWQCCTYCEQNLQVE